MIVGQTVWFTPNADCPEFTSAPLAAIVTHVFDDDELPEDMRGKGEVVNLAVFHADGTSPPFGEKCVPILSGTDRPDTEFCEPMTEHAKHKEHKKHFKTRRAAKHPKHKKK